MEPIHKIFAAAARSLIGTTERGTKARIAREAGISFTQLSDILTGRRNGTEDQRRAIAEALGWGYEKILRLGVCVLDGREFAEMGNELEKENDPLNIPLFSSRKLFAKYIRTRKPYDEKNYLTISQNAIGRKTAENLAALKIDDFGLTQLAASNSHIVIDMSCVDVSKADKNVIYVISAEAPIFCTLKRLEVIKNKMVAVKNINNTDTAYGDFSNIDIIGRLIWVCQIVDI